MELSSSRSVALGSFAFLVFWVSATFPKFRGLPIGRTAGAIVSAALIVVFQVESPDEAYASLNLPILGLLFGTMVVSVYLQRADMFRYLASALSYRCQGGKDLLCRLSFLVAFTSALFTNDTCCVLFTEFILGFCNEKGLPPEPFLLALASSANLGSSATPIGNPQNLVIAIQSKISFGKFLVGLLPAMVLGVCLNLALLLGMYWKQLSNVNVPVHKREPKPEATLEFSDIRKTLDDRQSSRPYIDIEEGKDQTSAAAAIEDPPTPTINADRDGGATSMTFQSGSCSVININESSTPAASQAVTLHHPEATTAATPLADQAIAMELANNTCNRSLDGSRKQGRMLGSDEDEAPSGIAVGCPHIIYVVTDSPVLAEQQTRGMVMHTASSESPPATTMASIISLPTGCTQTTAKGKGWKWHLWKLSVYSVTLAMLAALLAGLDISWSAITAAVALIVLDFQDAAPSLAKVSYSLLVFFSGMFITVDGFNRTGLPSKVWSVVEPHARINHASGTTVLTAVVVLLSNVASNVPTVLLLGPRVAASSMAIPGVSITRAWLILAWASSVGGNLTLVGSAANLIVSEQARMATKVPYNLSFWRHMKFGLPSTLLTVAAGIPLIRG